MAEQSSVRRPDRPLPGTVKPARFRPRFHWELLACGTRGHELSADSAPHPSRIDKKVFELDGVVHDARRRETCDLAAS